MEVGLTYLKLSSLWTVACQASLSMGFSRQEYWNGLPCPPPGDLPDSEIKPRSPDCRQILYHLSHQTCLPTTICRGKPVASCVTVCGHTNSYWGRPFAFLAGLLRQHSVWSTAGIHTSLCWQAFRMQVSPLCLCLPDRLPGPLVTHISHLYTLPRVCPQPYIQISSKPLSVGGDWEENTTFFSLCREGSF